MTPERRITVVEVIRACGLEPTPSFATAVGNAVRDQWMKEHHGERPHQGLHQKTDGSGGTQMKSDYPFDWWAKIEAIVKSLAHLSGPSDQPDLF